MQGCDPILCKSILNSLVYFAEHLGNLGLSIILVTIILRALLIPVFASSIKNSQKMKEVAPLVNKLKKKHKDDPKKLQMAIADLYKQKGVNLTAGCLTQIPSFIILYGFFAALNAFLRNSNQDLISYLYPFNSSVNLDLIQKHFLYLDLSKPDLFNIPGIPFPLPGLLLILAVLIQFLSSKKMMPSVEKAQDVAKKTPDSIDDTLAASQQQMVYILPLITLVIGLTFPSGLVLNWFASSLFQLLLQDWYSQKSILRSFLPAKALVK